MKITKPDGSLLNATGLTVSYNVSFGNATVANTNIVLSTTRGDAVISFAIPRYTNSQFATIVFTVRATNLTYVYTQQVPVNNPEQLVIDFYPASGYLTTGVSNLVYFQVWANSNRDVPLDVSNIVVKHKQTTAANSEVIIYNGTLSTIAKGKGSFEFTPTAANQFPTFEIPTSTSVVKRSVVLT